MRTTKRIVSLLLAMVLLLGAFPFSALAADESQEAITDSQPVAAEELPEETPGETQEEATPPTETELPAETEPVTTEAATVPETTEAEPAPTEATEPKSTEVATEAIPETAETEATEATATATEPEETEDPTDDPEEAANALMKAASRAVHNGLYTWQDHILNYDKYYTFPNGGHVYGLPRLDYHGAPAYFIVPGVTAANCVNP